MREYASKKGVDYQKLKFEFDGESVKATDTVDSLDMEDEDCIDVIGIWTYFVLKENLIKLKK